MREWNNIDLLITCKEPQFAIVIENKIGSKEHSNQLGRYQRIMTEHYPELRPLYIYLTVDGDDPSEDSWVPYTYADIYRVLNRIREMYQNAIGDDVLVFLDHYLNLLGTRFMNDKELDQLCRQIYKNHRQALDLIWERAKESAVLVEVTNALERDERWQGCYRSSNYVEFVPKSWSRWLPSCSPSDDTYPCVVVNLRSKETSLVYKMSVGPMVDATKRKEIITKLREEAPKFGFERTKSKEIGDKWVRISANNVILEWGEDEEPEPIVIHDAVKKALDELYSKLEKLTPILKQLCSARTSQ
jgi:hypothetical protein